MRSGDITNIWWRKPVVIFIIRSSDKIERMELFMEKKKRYVQVGVGGRARFFYYAIAEKYDDTAEIVGFCDINPLRMEYAQNVLMERYHYPKVNLYGADEFEKMIEIEKPDCVIVTSIDRTHHKYIVRAMELGCDVISEKPMTTDEVKCQQILDAVKRGEIPRERHASYLAFWETLKNKHDWDKK